MALPRKRQQAGTVVLRDYQRGLLDAIYAWFENNEGHPCAVLPTAGGKSIVLAQFCKEQLHEYPKIHILMLAPTRELVVQDYTKLREAWPNAPVGVYSAALKRRELYEPITIANIHSIHDKANIMPVIDILLVDEAHLVPNTDNGMYRKLFTELEARNKNLVVIGFTATPYRLGQGELTEGPEALFDDLIEECTVGSLIRAGWLCRLRSKATELKLDVTGVHKRGGEFVESELQKAVDTEDINYVIANEIAAIASTHKRQAILVFCVGVEHAAHMAAELSHYFPTAIVTGKTPAEERAQIFGDFKKRKITALCNVQVATTGFDYPDIDLIALVRPTESKGLYVQMVGRGLRLKSHTDHAIVLDFAGNVERHGPVTEYEEGDEPKLGSGEAPTKKCPNCKEIVYTAVRICPACGHKFRFEPRESKLDGRLHDDDIMGEALKPPTVMPVKKWYWWKHTSKKTNKEMLAVKYTGVFLGTDVVEYFTVAHEGDVGKRSLGQLLKMMRDAGEDGLPDCETLEEAAEKLSAVRPPSEIEYRMEGKFPRMIRRTFGEMHAIPVEEPSDFDIYQKHDAPTHRSSKPAGMMRHDYDDDIPF